MQKIEFQATVYFERPFWVCVCERASDSRLEVCKITFGTEPKDYQVYEYLLAHWGHLRFSPPVERESGGKGAKKPKRMQREITRQLSGQGVGTRSQQALKLRQEQGKEARKKQSKQQRQEEQRRRFQLRQQKKRARKKGR